MIKNYLKTIILTCVLICVPVIFGLTIWNKMPELIPSHFDTQGNVNGWSTKAEFVFLVPGIMLITQLFIVLCLSLDKKSERFSKKIIYFILWMLPAVNLFAEGICYAFSLGAQLDISMLLFLFTGIVYLIFGNLMGKIPSNYVIGFRMITTLNDKNNWIFTHRVSGWCFVITGLLLIITAFLENWIIYFACIGVNVVIPFICSIIYALLKK